ncbi:inhibitor of KinA [Parapedobacter composti]|uniref:Inhibitor of KinA n=1 Tax=Parapedobacter composti TaxID=623281 RepID=A0A1I1KP21_9SPHI|nr:5-oxoprolinase subunit PxpB [Parapedobacter composti]SFC62529.1 inhibitor of KinA [Parapedobacter composti]
MDIQTQTNDGFTIYSLSEFAVAIEFAPDISTDTLERITRFNALLCHSPFDGFRTTVPAYTTLSIFFDPVVVIQSPRLHGINCFERVAGFLKGLNRGGSTPALSTASPIAIPVCYGGVSGPDLNEVARSIGMTPDEVIQLHSTAVYHVYMVGFTPGFAYLGGMPGELSSPRKSTPRGTVPAGSIGIAGKQTGIYSLESPGGWQIIGRTPLRLFDANNAQPTLLKAGDRVVFKVITECR